MALGDLVAVPLTNPESVPGLMRTAAMFARADEGVVVPVTVVPVAAAPEERDAAERLIAAAEAELAALGVSGRGRVCSFDEVAVGVLSVLDDLAATLVVIGWRGASSRHNVFGELIDTIVGHSAAPLAVIRFAGQLFTRVVVPVSDEHLLPGGHRGVDLAAELARRCQESAGAPVWILRTGELREELPETLLALSDRVHHDPRSVIDAIGDIAASDDLILTPVAPTASGLRMATTHIAWAAPETPLLVAVDVGPAPGESLVSAVDEAGVTPQAPGAAAATHHHRVRVTVHGPGTDAAPIAADELRALLAVLGEVAAITEWSDPERGPSLQAHVVLATADRHEALSEVMTALHQAPRLSGAEIRYDVVEASAEPD